ncbi:MAG TPA: protoporphyrinogen oxidase [Candidatus Polarisedimenticolia bacterium]|jgi:oxygen-dependent protoporphyrinogen oxidase|nr:protoporphyrinogen oxidase [Candidatus Polarisedimenticolia bacterium]
MSGPAAADRGGRDAQAPALDVAIVGGGIAGLATAEALVTRGRERGVPIRPTILEAAPRTGGVIATERTDGFVIESGPDCFITDKPWGVTLCERLGLDGELVGTNPACRRSFILRGRRLLPVPEGFQLLAPSRLGAFAASPVLGLGGRLRAALDLVLPRGEPRPDESLASFVRRRFGTQALERLAQPLLAGVYGADPERLSLRATMPRFLDLERDHRSVILGLMRGRRQHGPGRGVSGARYSLFVTPRRGMASIVERLEQGLPPGSIRIGTRVAALEAGPLDPRRRRFTLRTASGGTIDAHAVVLALHGPDAAALVAPLDATLASRLAAIRYGSSTTVSLAWRQEDVARRLDGFGFVVPRSEGRRLVACSFSSIKFAERAPEGHLLVRAFLGDGGDAPESPSDDEAAIATVRRELGEILKVEAEPLLARVTHHRGAMAQYEVGHLERAAEIESRLEAHLGLALAGNSLRGVGVPDCIRSGEAAAERILSQASRLVS